MIFEEEGESSSDFLGSVEGEISFFRSVMRTRPVGIHRHFHVLSIRNAIEKDTGRLVSTDDIWEKLKTCYDLDALEGLEVDGYDTQGSNASTPASISSPSPSENLASHPFFRDEYALPHDDFVDSLVSKRRIRDTPSPPSSRAQSSPAPSEPVKRRTHSKRKRGKSKLDLAGLVGGDSDSSALTQESGDEDDAETLGESVESATDGGAKSPSPKTMRSKASKPTKKPGTSVRTRATAASSSRPAAKRRKR